MQALFESLLELLQAILAVLIEFALVLQPWSLLLVGLGAWIVFWTFGVNWVTLREMLLRGGWVAVLLIGLVVILVWGTVHQPLNGQEHLLGLTLSNYVGKTVSVTGLFCIMFLCGSVQLSGCCSRCCSFDEKPIELESQRSEM